MSKKSIFLSSLFCSFVGLFVLIVLPKSVYASFRFVSWADTKSSRSQLATLSRQITDNNLSPVFTIYPGDLESDGFTLSGMNLWKDAINGGSSPGNGIFDITFPTRGNHDFHVSGSTPDWQNYFNMHGVAQRVGATNYRESREDLTYSFDYDNAHFVGIDDDGGAGAITSDDESWLDNDLSLAESRGLTHAFIFFHGPLYPVDGHCCSGNSDIINIINDHPIVSATFHGHEHLYTHTTLDSSLISGLTRSFEQFITGSAGAGPSSARSDREYDYYMNSDGFVTVDVSNQSYTVTWYKLNSSTPQHTMTFTKSGNTTGTTTPTKTPTISPTKTPTPTKSPTVSPTKTPTPTQVEGDVVNISPSEDTFVRGGSYASTNYGTENSLIVKDAADENYDRYTYLKFDLGGLSGKTIFQAKLKLYVNALSNGTPAPAYVFPLTNDSWSENQLTWNNKPLPSNTSLEEKSILQTGWIEYYVTDYIQVQVDGDKVASLVILDPTQQNKVVNMNSSDASSNNPYLEVVLKEGSVTNTPTPTVPPGGCTPGQLPGDGNGDCTVDGIDYGIWYINYGTIGKSVSEGNYNEDSQGTVDGLDYGVWYINYGKTINPGGETATSSKTPTVSPTKTPTVTPSKTPTPTPSGPTPTLPPVTPSSGIWTSAEELASKLTQGDAWDAVKSAADSLSSSPTPDLDNQDDNTNVDVLAAAIVYARTGNNTYRNKVVRALQYIEGFTPNGRTLAWARETGAYALSADLVGYRTSSFEKKMRDMAETYIGSQTNKNLLGMFKMRPNNWGSQAFGSLTAIYRYLGDDARLNEVRSYMIQSITGPKPSQASYGSLTWQCNESDPRWINPQGCTKNCGGTVNVDGIIPDDMRRGGSCSTTPASTGYPWEGLQGFTMGAYILERAGLSIWGVDNSAICRAYAALEGGRFGSGWKATGDDEWQLPFADHGCGTNWSASHGNGKWGSGKNTGWAYVL
jgi:hypothetical protein